MILTTSSWPLPGIIMSQWLSVTMIWLASILNHASIGFVYVWARISNASSTLLISLYVLFYLLKALFFIQRYSARVIQWLMANLIRYTADGAGMALSPEEGINWTLCWEWGETLTERLPRTQVTSPTYVCRRIQGVCFVCLVVFSLRWVLLILQVRFYPILWDCFLFVTEIVPTSYMLFVFRRYPPTGWETSCVWHLLKQS